MISVKLALPLGRGTTPSPKSSLLLTIDQLQGLLLGSGDLLLPPG